MMVSERENVTETQGRKNLLARDKSNNVDYVWLVVRTPARHEAEVASLLREWQARIGNILEVYCPMRGKTESRSEKDKDASPLLPGQIFVLSTHSVLENFLREHCPECSVMYCKKLNEEDRARVMTIPEAQMRFFMDFNENYAERVIVLERPYSDYAFNPKNNEPNEIVKVLDGPLAGHTGYMIRVRGDRRLVFKIESGDRSKSLAVSIPEIWNFHVVRLHNAKNDRQSIGTAKARAVDLLIDMIQRSGYGADTLAVLYRVVDSLVEKASLESLRGKLRQQDERLWQAVNAISPEEAALLLDLIRYEREHPGYVRTQWHDLIIRPFLTPVAGGGMGDIGQGSSFSVLPHPHLNFIEIVRKETFLERAYYEDIGEEKEEEVTYFSHTGLLETQGGRYILFANWDEFLGQYFRTGGHAKEKLLVSFSNFAPTLYGVLTGKSEVSVVRDLHVGGKTLNALVISGQMERNELMSGVKGEDLLENPCVETSLTQLVQTGLSICKEINSTTHLAVWRRYLRTVWLHR